MKIVLLGSKDTFHISRFVESEGDLAVCKDDRVSLDWLKEKGVEFIVSYGYGYILKADVIQAYRGKAINLHISYLPWNRGRSPNFWSFLYGTPKGVTIHYLDEGIDTGDIIVRRRVHFSDSETLRTSFAKLRDAMELLFYECWAGIREGRCGSFKQNGDGSYQSPKAMEFYQHLLYNGWDTPVRSFAKAER